MLSKYCIIFENGESVKKIMKTTKAILRNNYESITWLEENDKRGKKLINNGYWVYSIICINKKNHFNYGNNKIFSNHNRRQP